MAEVRVYTCPDGIHRSLYPDLRDCPSFIGASETVRLGEGRASRRRFLGSTARGAAEVTPLPLPVSLPFPELNRKTLLLMGAIVLGIFLFVILSRRRRHGSS